MLAPSQDPDGVRFLRIVERVEGFILQRFDAQRRSLGDLQFDTMDEAMGHVYAEYREISDWRFCRDGTDREG